MEQDKTRDLLIRIRGLLLLAVDLIERECLLGKYAVKSITVSRSDSIAGAVSPPLTTQTTEL